MIQKQLVPLFSAAIIALRKEVALPVPDENAFLQILLLWSLDQAGIQQQRDAIYHTIGSVVNKRVEGLSTFLSEQLDVFWASKVADASVAADFRRKAISTWVWVGCPFSDLTQTLNQLRCR